MKKSTLILILLFSLYCKLYSHSNQVLVEPKEMIVKFQQNKQMVTQQPNTETITVVFLVSASVVLIMLILFGCVVLFLLASLFICCIKSETTKTRGVSTFVDSEHGGFGGGNNQEKYYPQENDEFDTFNSHQL
jgi:hypothetical protein